MKERPILFSGPLVRAILAGRKTQTRRPVKFKDCGFIHLIPDEKKCPYGQPVDRLWVREALHQDDEDGLCYAADGAPVHSWPDEYCYRNLKVRTIPSIHMPRWASRIALEIVNVRVERVQEISRPDLRAEGQMVCGDHGACDCDRQRFAESWTRIYPGSWDRNDWVWVVEFKRI